MRHCISRIESTIILTTLYPDTKGSVRPMSSPNVAAMWHIDCKTHFRKAPSMKPVTLVLYEYDDRIWWLAANIMQLINTTCVTSSRFFVVANPITRHAKNRKEEKAGNEEQIRIRKNK